MKAICHLLPLLTYGSPLMIGDGQVEAVINAIYKCQMTISQWICFKESVESISKSVKWASPMKTLLNNIAILIKKVIFNSQPIQLLDYI